MDKINQYSKLIFKKKTNTPNMQPYVNCNEVKLVPPIA